MNLLRSFKARTETHFASTACFLLVSVFILYQFLFLRYRPYDVDNPWFLSFSYNRFVENIDTDYFLRVPFPYGMDGTLYFGRLGAMLQGGVAELFGWHQRPFAVLSSLLVVLTLGVWMWTLRRLNYSPALIFTFVTAAGMTEPFVGSANRFRFEPLSVLLHAVALLLSTANMPFVAVFIATVSVAVEPAAALGIIPVLFLCVFRDGWSKRLCLYALLGIALGVIIISLLQPQLLHLLSLFKAAQPSVGRMHESVMSYYVMPRHLPETLFFAVSCWLLLLAGRRINSSDAWVAYTFCGMYVAVLFLPHFNVLYAVFYYPYLLLMTLLLYKSDRALAYVAAGFLTYGCAQDTVATLANRGQGYSTSDLNRVNTLLHTAEQKIHRNDDAIRVVGDYSLWFAHPHAYVGISYWTMPLVDTADIVLCYQQYPPGLSRPHMPLCQDILSRNKNLHLLSTANLHENIVYLYTNALTGKSQCHQWAARK